MANCPCCGGGTLACVMPACLTTLDMGTTSETNGSKLWARFRHQPTGRIQQVEVTVASGRVPVPLALTPEGTIYSSTCFTLQFEDVWDDTVKWNYNGLTIKLEV
jgi:hypothetical protein